MRTSLAAGLQFFLTHNSIFALVGERGETGAMFRFDAHVHSVVSDGTESPAQVMEAAAHAGLDAVALTDHDTFEGLAAAHEAAERVGIELVPGVELSTKVGGVSLHMLAYYPAQGPSPLTDLMERIRQSRLLRIQEMAGRLGVDYPEVSWEALQELGGDDKSWGRPHLADLLVGGGYFRDRAEAFQTVLHPYSPYYVRQWSPAPEDMVRAVRDAGGVPVMAHPQSNRRGKMREETLERMVEAGLFGLERDHREHDRVARAQINQWAGRWGLAVTGGSDYHGLGKPNRLGENLTSEEVLAQIKRRAGR